MMRTIRKGQRKSLNKYITRHNILGLSLCVTIMCVLSDLALSVRTYYDNIAFVFLLLSFAFCIVIDLIKDKSAVLKRIKDLFYSAKWLYIALIAYYLWDIITMMYTRNIDHALSKLPYMIEYTSIFLIGLYYCSTQKRLLCVMSSVALTGTIVSILTYIYYFSSRNPIYYQRLSTARDYNVYACLVFICFVFAADLIINYSKLSFLRRILIFTAVCAINIPTFYLSGSRRMFIMLPFFFAFAVLYEGIRLIISRKKAMSLVSHNLAFFVIAVVIYFGAVSCLGLFSEIGSQKEADYKDYIKQQQLEGKEIIIKPPSYKEKTISSVLETIENKTMYSKRSLIYSVAFNELKQYKPVEFIFGRGAAYDIHMFDVTTDEALLKAYSIDEKNPRPSGWLSAHSFALADILNGGIIKLSLAMFLIFQISRHAIIAIKQQKRAGLILVIPFALVISNNFISGAYGMLNDVFFQTIMLILCSMLYINKKEHLDESK